MSMGLKITVLKESDHLWKGSYQIIDNGEGDIIFAGFGGVIFTHNFPALYKFLLAILNFFSRVVIYLYTYLIFIFL